MTAILDRYPTAAAAHADGWNRQAWNDADEDYGITGIIHHEHGCQGSRGTPDRIGWHTEDASIEELARMTWLCDHCLRSLEPRAQRPYEPRYEHWTQEPKLRVKDATAARIGREARLARQMERRAARRGGAASTEK